METVKTDGQRLLDLWNGIQKLRKENLIRHYVLLTDPICIAFLANCSCNNPELRYDSFGKYLYCEHCSRQDDLSNDWE